MMDYATWECICHPSVAKGLHERCEKSVIRLKGYNVSKGGKAWTEYRGAQAAG